MAIEFLLIDLDDTILDFQMAEAQAIRSTFAAFSVEPTRERCELYSRINLGFWKRLERGELTREQLIEGRFAALTEALGISGDALAWAQTYSKNLSQGAYFLPGAEAALERLAKKYRLFLASNGNAAVQEARLKKAKLCHFFEDIFISEQLGANKPSKAFFDQAFSRIPGFDKEKAMIVGDSLTSDILGGNNAGISTCWVNPKHLPRRADIRVDHEIEALAQLEPLLET